MNGSSRAVKRILHITLLIGLLLTPAELALIAETDSQTPVQQSGQTECPVMVGNKIDPDLYTVYQGKKVYFCCSFCKGEFEKAPEKYLHRLPQFASVSTSGTVEEEHEESLAMELIELTGACTLILVAATVTLGILRRRWKPRLMLKTHKTCGALALISGATHASLVMFLH